jgi:hypothetical protein
MAEFYEFWGHMGEPKNTPTGLGQKIKIKIKIFTGYKLPV